MKTITLTIFDETLRDGEQQVGIFFDPEIKHTLAQLIVKTGVHHLALMPAIHHTEAKLVKNLLDRGFKQSLVASTMMGKKYIDESIECGVETIIIFNAVSDRLLWLRDPQFRDRVLERDIQPEILTNIRRQMLDKVLKHLKYATAKGLKICFAAEDASRADFDFLVECITKFQPYIDHFLLCDTVGILTPEATKLWVRNLIDFTGNKTPFTVHFHNDRGLAVENTIQAILAGAKGISGTFGGIGERAGNTAIEQVLNGLKLRYGWQVTGINYDALCNITNYLASKGFRANSPYSPESLRYETGIHVESLLRDRDSYYLFETGEPEIYFGKFSGASNFKYLFEKQLNIPLSPRQYQQFREKIKQLSIQQKRSFSATEVIELLDYSVVN
ncbi:MAG: 2-isopropylmalate synthase [Pleurocapsa sp. MO_226.B13]|nr:2-isopropylmalate synthase [Pleurocapsa sp. MO_226.B13]